MPLVDYGSDSDTDHHPSTQKQLPTVDDHTMDDEDDDTYDPKDAFGLARLPEEHLQLKADAQPAAGAAKQAASSAPEVISSDLHSAHSSLITRPTDNIIFYNASYSDLTRPVQGPANPWDDKRLDKQNTLT
ncbi:hypothetical protein JCM1841_006440, partial [Sporobolomyces salmonicolor]